MSLNNPKKIDARARWIAGKGKETKKLDRKDGVKNSPPLPKASK